MKDLRRISVRQWRGFTLLIASLGGGLILASCGGGAGRTSSDPGAFSRAEVPMTAVAVSLRVRADITTLARQYGAVIKGGSKADNVYRLLLPSDRAKTLLPRMRMDPRILFAEPDELLSAPETDSSIEGDPIHVPFDFSMSVSVSSFSDSYYSLANTDVNQVAYQQINLSDVPTATRGAGITVAVLDTGVQADHPSLQGHLVPGYNALVPGTLPNDIADGTTNAVLGHGTMVSGIISRLAPDAKILPIRVLNADGRGSLVSTVLGIRYAVQQGAKVLNLSLGTPVNSEMMRDAIVDARAAGCVVVAAAGNANSNTPQYPAAYSGVLAVVAVNNQNQKANFSNYGTFVTIAAPGTAIRSTFVGGGYASWSGTSFAAPFVSAAAALARAAHPDWTGGWTTQRLWQTAQSINDANPTLAGQLGKGLLNIKQAVK